ncbi:MAG TPA: aminoglycoside phosphotransferase family protein [Jatrophihabitans sp.]|jgi:aminoglycoside phosphotransferase (APT) family kinase protein
MASSRTPASLATSWPCLEATRDRQWRTPDAAEHSSVGQLDAELLGGVANAGRVFRLGAAVQRPAPASRDAVHRLLGHLHAVGFAGAPRVLSTCGDQELLSWVPGRAAAFPLPPWAVSDAALASVGALIRRFHDAIGSFTAPDLAWPEVAIPEPYRDGRISHNDLHPGNIVFADDVAVGLIDFDLAGPGGLVWDLASLVRYWCPLVDDPDLPPGDADRRLDRFGLLLDAYGLQGEDRVAVADALIDNHDWTYRIVMDEASRGHDGFRRHWNEIGGLASRSRAWILERSVDLRAAAR